MSALLALLAVSVGPPDPELAARERMVSEQVEARGVADPRLLEVLRRVPRHLFVPPGNRALSYEDRPVPIGFGQTISQPYIVAAMTEILELEKGDKTLEIGTGSGYQAAVLAGLVERVYSIEIVPELLERARAALQAHGTKVRTRSGDGWLGWPEEAPFDKIIVTAAASHVPPPLVKQLAEGGRMVIPVGSPFQTQDLLLLEKRGGRVRTRSLMPVRFVPLVRRAERP